MSPKQNLLIAVALLIGCGERERLTFPDLGDEVGPVSIIDEPSIDSVLTDGDPFVVAGRTVDANGVDTVYFEVSGGNQNFLPFAGQGDDTVRFGLPLVTVGRAGQTIIVRVQAIDLLGNLGAPVTRRLSVR